eukprot:GHVS01022685.1.p1 GENE.GHVS01022685.1~~GHVS01022685.1.p1  ORF type:complete len:374 (-),score=77.76 GHVS01022685.1:469-1590(-)
MKEMPTGMKEMPTGMKEMPTGMKEMPTGMKEMPTGMKEMPTGMKEMPTGRQTETTLEPAEAEGGETSQRWWWRMCQVVMVGLKIQLGKIQDALTQCKCLCEEGGDLLDIALFRRGQCEFLLNDKVSAKASFVACQAKQQTSATNFCCPALPLDQWMLACSADDTSARPPAKKLRHEWSQNVGSLTLTIYCKNMQSTENCQLDFAPPYSSLAVHLTQPDLVTTASIGPFTMGGEVKGNEAKVLLSKMKVEIVIPKVSDGLWQNIIVAAPEGASVGAASTYPTSSKTKRDWDNVDKECSKEVEKDIREAGGDAALNEMFRDIYSKGSDETRRAMIKSFQTSCGTVLSTNWEEVKEKEYENELSAPSGQKVKKWEE